MTISEHQNLLNALDENENRVLGVLCEKQLTGSKAYPMTLSDTRIACNQKSGRQVRMNMDLESVRIAARQLAARGLVAIDFSGRSERYAHCVNTALCIDHSSLAILTAQLLRGALSVAQLRSATRRLYPFSSNREIEQILNASDLFVIASRVPGQRGHRYTHALAARLDNRADTVSIRTTHTTRPSGSLEGVRRDLDQLQNILRTSAGYSLDPQKR